MVTAARAAGVRRVVKLSVWRAPEELTPIARLHRPVEQALADSGLEWTLLRPNFYMQNFLRLMARSIRATRSFSQPESRAPVSFVDARDVAQVAAHVLTSPGHEGRSYDLTGPQALTFDQAASVLSDVIGSRVTFAGISDDQARAVMLADGLPLGYVESLIEVARAYRDGGAQRVTSSVQDLIGRPATSFAAFVRDHRAEFI